MPRLSREIPKEAPSEDAKLFDSDNNTLSSLDKKQKKNQSKLFLSVEFQCLMKIFSLPSPSFSMQILLILSVFVFSPWAENRSLTMYYAQ